MLPPSKVYPQITLYIAGDTVQFEILSIHDAILDLTTYKSLKGANGRTYFHSLHVYDYFFKLRSNHCTAVIVNSNSPLCVPKTFCEKNYWIWLNPQSFVHFQSLINLLQTRVKGSLGPVTLWYDVNPGTIERFCKDHYGRPSPPKYKNIKLDRPSTNG